MIVSDSSALLAIVLGEPDYRRYGTALVTNTVTLSAASLTESRIAVERRSGPMAVENLERLVREYIHAVVPYGEDHARAAHLAWRRFGKGRHPASLNFGDCMAYATAKVAGAPLLFKGDDFAQTDIASAL